MAWLMQHSLLERYQPRFELTPPRLELHQMRTAYAAAHPEIFPRGERFFLTQGGTFPKEYFPTSARLISRHKALPDAINLGGFGVSRRLRDIIERLEPGVHQFHEVPVKWRDGTPVEETYYAMIIGRIMDHQTILSESRIGISKIPRPDGGHKVNVPRKDSQRMIAIDRSNTTGWHLWISWDIYDMLTISDELYLELKENKIVGLQFTELLEI